jgi:hypothetical protein
MSNLIIFVLGTGWLTLCIVVGQWVSDEIRYRVATRRFRKFRSS